MRTAIALLTLAPLLQAGCAVDAPMAHRWPPVDALPELDQLPDPFAMRDGSRVRTPADWRRRRAEIIAMLAHYEYGHTPPPPDNLRAVDVSTTSVLQGRGRLRRTTLEMGPDHRVRVRIGIYLPTRPAGPVPVLLSVEPVWDESLQPVADLALRRGYAFAGYVPQDLDPDDDDRTNGVHPLYPEYDWATLAAWAWGAMRLLDYLNTLPEIDTDRVAITGHSRCGKTALLAGALDARFALVAPHASGCGGAASHRIDGPKCETLPMITEPERFHYWFHPRLRTFAGKEARLPFDQHFLRALVAPRPVVSIDGLDDLWANPLGTQQIGRATQPVYDFLGVAHRNVAHFRPGGHDTTLEDWRVLLDYCDHFLRGKPRPHTPTRLPDPDAPRPFRWQAPE